MIFHREKKQNGAIVVMTALLMPVMIAFTGMAVDFGGYYMRKSQLQNASDASALAGAWQLGESSKVDSTVQSYLIENLEDKFSNIQYTADDNYPSDEKTVNYSTTQKTSELDVTLRCNMQTSFVRFFGITSIPVTATSKAQVDDEKLNDDMFKYTMVAGHKSSKDYDPSNWKSLQDESGIWFHTPGVSIAGDIMTNGKINFDQSQVTTLDGHLYADRNLKRAGKMANKDYWLNNTQYDKKFDPDVWASSGWNKGMIEYYTFKDANGNSFMTEKNIGTSSNGRPYMQDVNREDLVTFKDAIDISVENNKDIKRLLKEYKEKSISDREQQHIYYDDNTSNGSYNFSSSHTRIYPALTSNEVSRVVSDKDTSVPVWERYYTRIVVPGDIQVSFENSPKPGDKDLAMIVSLNGNITIPNGIDFNGILYAPNGIITINGTCKVNGSVIAQQILITTPQQEVSGTNSINHKPYISGFRKVSLIK